MEILNVFPKMGRKNLTILPTNGGSAVLQAEASAKQVPAREPPRVMVSTRGRAERSSKNALIMVYSAMFFGGQCSTALTGIQGKMRQNSHLPGQRSIADR